MSPWIVRCKECQVKTGIYPIINDQQAKEGGIAGWKEAKGEDGLPIITVNCPGCGSTVRTFEIGELPPEKKG